MNDSEWLHKGVLAAVMLMLRDPRAEVTFRAPTVRPYVAGLHQVALTAVETGADFLLILDDDNPPQANPIDLAFLDLDVVSLPTPIWHYDENYPDHPITPNAWDAVVEDGEVVGYRPITATRTPEGLEECDAVGTGCMLIARRVLVDLFARCEGDPMNAPFMRRWNDRGGVEAGNDMAFCERARAAGFRVYSHFGYPCSHHKQVDLALVQECFMRLIARGRA